MSKFVINDLTDSVELDREALGKIYGGSKLPAGRPPLAQRHLRRQAPLFFQQNKGKKRR